MHKEYKQVWIQLSKIFVFSREIIFDALNLLKFGFLNSLKSVFEYLESQELCQEALILRLFVAECE